MRIAIRADALPVMGAGHLMRCLTLADTAARNGASVIILSRGLPPHLAGIVTGRGHRLVGLPAGRERDTHLVHSAWLGASQSEDADACLAALTGDPCDWLVVDHYALDAGWERAMRAAADRVLTIDDLADRAHDCDVLLDQNAYAAGAARYDGLVPAAARRLLGPRFALLREEFAAHRPAAPRGPEPVGRVLVSFGGVDEANHTERAVEALAALKPRFGFETDVVLGAGHPRRDAVARRCAAQGFACHVQTGSMAALMAAADLAVGAGGSATWERCAVGLPSYAFAVADNQRQLLIDAAALGVLYMPDAPPEDAGTLAAHLAALFDSGGLRAHLSQNGLQLVDARGAARVLRAMQASHVTIRPAQPSDGDALFTWRNDPRIRSLSRNSAPLARDQHDRWFDETRASADRHLLIGRDGAGDVGVVRFDVAGREAEVSIYLVPDRLQSGLGPGLFAAAEAWLRAHDPRVDTLSAEVLGANHRSHAFFRGAGFEMSSARYRKPHGRAS